MKQQDIFIPILAGTLLFIMVSFFINALIFIYKGKRKQHEREILLLEKRYEQELLQAQIEVQESTYRHVAKELHDNVGQLLSTAKMLMGVTELRMPEIPETLILAKNTLSDAIKELRLLSRSLDSEWLRQFKLVDNLHSEMDRINASNCISADVDCQVEIDMKPEVQIILFRVVQEAIHNALKHAEPSHIKVIIRNNNGLEVLVNNDGKPLPINFQGMGTANMLHRVKLLNGNVSWNAGPEQTSVQIHFSNHLNHEN